MKKAIAVVMFIFCMAVIPQKGMAMSSSSLQIIGEDCLWGVVIGALVGAATLAFTEDPGEMAGRRIAQGASIGTLCGLVFGFYEISPMFQAMEDPVTKEKTYAFSVTVPLK